MKILEGYVLLYREEFAVSCGRLMVEIFHLSVGEVKDSPALCVCSAVDTALTLYGAQALDLLSPVLLKMMAILLSQSVGAPSPHWL